MIVDLVIHLKVHTIINGQLWVSHFLVLMIPYRGMAILIKHVILLRLFILADLTVTKGLKLATD